MRKLITLVSVVFAFTNMSAQLKKLTHSKLDFD